MRITAGDHIWNPMKILVKKQKDFRLHQIQKEFPAPHRNRTSRVNTPTNLPRCHHHSIPRKKWQPDNKNQFWKSTTCLTTPKFSSKWNLVPCYSQQPWASMQHSKLHPKFSHWDAIIHCAWNLLHTYLTSDNWILSSTQPLIPTHLIAPPSSIWTRSLSCPLLAAQDIYLSCRVKRYFLHTYIPLFHYRLLPQVSLCSIISDICKVMSYPT